MEDLYLPYKPKRRTKGEIARERGLEPLADALLADRALVPAELAQGYVQGEVTDVKMALDGARDILVERFAEDAALLGQLRQYLRERGVLSSKVFEGKEEAGAKFADYFDHRGAVGEGRGAPCAGDDARPQRGHSFAQPGGRRRRSGADQAGGAHGGGNPEHPA